MCLNINNKQNIIPTTNNCNKNITKNIIEKITKESKNRLQNEYKNIKNAQVFIRLQKKVGSLSSWTDIKNHLISWKLKTKLGINIE